MFNSLSQQEVIPRGKKVDPEKSRKFQESQWTLGNVEKPTNYQSVKNYFHNEKNYVPVIPQSIKRDSVNKHHWDIAMTDKIDPKTHFKTETKAQFEAPIKPQKVGAVRDKQSLMKSQYNLGEEKVEYKTHSQKEFYDKSAIKSEDIRPKQKERYDIVTGGEIQQTRLKNANAFDYYNHDKSKNRTSNNITEYMIPGVKLDPITRRILPISFLSYEDRYRIPKQAHTQIE